MSDEQTGLPTLYTTVEREGRSEWEEKKSVFIGCCVRVTDADEAMAVVKAKKKQYSDARHNVWAYLLKGGMTARYSDDGEPQGTAGVPMLEVLRKSGAEDVLVVVTRYFGGILLGAGGLARAYANTAKMALDDAHIITYEAYSELSLTCSYADYQKISAVLPGAGAIIDATDFRDTVEVRFAVKASVADSLCAKIREMTAGRVLPRTVGERYDFR